MAAEKAPRGPSKGSSHESMRRRDPVKEGNQLEKEELMEKLSRLKVESTGRTKEKEELKNKC